MLRNNEFFLLHHGDGAYNHGDIQAMTSEEMLWHANKLHATLTEKQKAQKREQDKAKSRQLAMEAKSRMRRH